jgi:hypothetical protein
MCTSWLFNKERLKTIVRIATRFVFEYPGEFLIVNINMKS